MKLKLLKDKYKAIAEAKEMISALQAIENKFLFTELHFAEKDIRQSNIGLHIREAIEQTSELVITLEGLNVESETVYERFSKLKLVPSFEMPEARTV